MKSYNFEILGKVQAKQRPRFNGKFAYTPSQTKIFENWVKESFLVSNKNATPIVDNPIKVEIVTFFDIPKSASKKKQQLMISGKIRPTIKPDTDNIAKSILDSLNGIAYSDDKQIVELVVKKYYSMQPRSIVKIKEIEINEMSKV